MRGSDASHVEFEQEFAIHLSVRDGKIARIHGFLTWQGRSRTAGVGRCPRVGGAQTKFRSVNRDEWRYKVRPECRGKAQEAVAQLRALGIRAELRGDTLLLTLEDTEIDSHASEMLERAWPNWRECVSE